ncbi:MAG TPA: M14 family zinc carboxypeptidase [Bacteroidales bacterium]|nr:M14 family zinc carboxypeptidase [Bacteroidales bacterium]
MLVLIGLPVIVLSQTYPLEKLYEDRPEVYFKLDITDPSVVMKLSKLISIDAVNEQGLTAYANTSQFAQLKNLGFKPELLLPPSLLETVAMTDLTDDRSVFEWDAYPTYEAYVQLMQDFENDYPEHCQVFTFATLNSGRELLMARINNGETSGKPKFLYTSSMHGDETTGYVLMLRLIDYLLSNYGIDDRVTNLVDNLDIFINPLGNPDGTYYAGNHTVNGSIRGNANGIDLNRNYHDPEDGPHPDGYAYQAETIAFMELAEQYQFVMSANFHGGAEVVNYPWDTWSRLHADDDWWMQVSREYADSAQFYSPSGYLTDLNNGITNGYAWYSITGSRQDYMNYFAQCREVTLEISDIKTLPANQLPAFWNYNKASLLSYMERALYGVQGTITDASTGEAVEALVSISGYDFDNSQVYSSSDDGFYHRVLKSGQWDITYSSAGYYPQTISVEIDEFETLVQDIALESGTLIPDFSASAYNIPKGESVDFTNESYGLDIVSYEWIFEGGTPATSTAENPENIAYNETGSFDVRLTITDNEGESSTILKEDLINVNLVYLMQNGTFTMCEGMFYDTGGPDDNYGNNQNFVMTLLPETEQSAVVVDFLSFSVEHHSNCNYDWLKIYNGISSLSPLIGTYCGTNSPGEVIATNEQGALTFVFHSDNNVNELGWSAIVSCTSTTYLHEKNHTRLLVWPNPSSERMINIQTDEEIVAIEISNLQGNPVWREEASGKLESLNLEILPAGMYMLKVELQSGEFVTKKIILK